MNTYIGIDLGTSSVKLLLVNAEGEILNSATKHYPISFPRPGWSEQNPADWWEATKKGIVSLLKGFDSESVKAISFGGQMHGLVILDREDKVIRPCILWNDGRSAAQTEFLNKVIGRAKISEYTANIAFAGFTAPKLLWMKENEPENFVKISKVMLPKDYLTYKLSGVHATDYSDASGTLLLDVKRKTWSEEMCKICGLQTATLPKLFESYDIVGHILSEIAHELKLSPDVLIIAGASDNAAAAIGTGTIGNNQCNISLGTSGTLFISSNTFRVNRDNDLHAFCHADGHYHLMGVVLSAAAANKWWVSDILKTKYNFIHSGLDSLLGENNIYFLPYLMGERSPHNDLTAKSLFIGMRPNTTRKEMSLAVLEGVGYALRESLEAAISSGIVITDSKICGGGSKSELWKKIIANILNLSLVELVVDEGPAFGAALLAMTGNKEYIDIEKAVTKCVKVRRVIEPENKIVEKYNKGYALYKTLYPALRDVFKIF